MNKYQYKVQGVDYDVEIVEVEGNIAKVKVNGIEFEVELKEPIHASTMPKHPIAVKRTGCKCSTCSSRFSGSGTCCSQAGGRSRNEGRSTIARNYHGSEGESG